VRKDKLTACSRHLSHRGSAAEKFQSAEFEVDAMTSKPIRVDILEMEMSKGLPHWLDPIALQAHARRGGASTLNIRPSSSRSGGSVNGASRSGSTGSPAPIPMA